MHIYEGGDFSTMQEHLEQTHIEEQKTVLHYSLYHHSCWLCTAFTIAKHHLCERPELKWWWTLTFHATAILLEGVACGALVLCLLTAWGGHTALRGKGCMICWNEVLSAPCVILANPLRAASLGTGRDNGHGLLQRAGLHLSTQTCRRKEFKYDKKINKNREIKCWKWNVHNTKSKILKKLLNIFIKTHAVFTIKVLYGLM